MSSTEEQLYPMLLPEDEDGLIWHLVEMTKEEVIATLEANSCENNSVSELILEYNQGYITEFGLSVVKFSEAPLEVKLSDSSYFISYFLPICFIVFVFGFIIAWSVAHVVDRFGF